MDKTIAGYFNDGYDINRGFVRRPDGNVTLSDALEALAGDYQGAVVAGMNALRVIAALYAGSTGINHVFCAFRTSRVVL